MELLRIDQSNVQATRAYSDAPLAVRKGMMAGVSQNMLTSPEMTLKFIAGEIAKACTRVGQKDMPKERYELMRQDLHDWVNQRAKNWTADEISLALQDGALNNPDVKHVTSPTLIKWLEEYMTTTKREAWAAIRKAREQQRREASDPKKMTAEESAAFVANAYGRWQKDNIRLAWSVVYDHLLRLQEISLNPVEKRDYIAKARAKVMEDGRKYTEYMDRLRRRRMEEVKALDVFNMQEGQTIPDWLVVEAKHMIVGDTFVRWKREGR